MCVAIFEINTGGDKYLTIKYINSNPWRPSLKDIEVSQIVFLVLQDVPYFSVRRPAEERLPSIENALHRLRALYPEMLPNIQKPNLALGAAIKFFVTIIGEIEDHPNAEIRFI